MIRYQNNPLKHPENQIEKIANSIKSYGFLVPILIDENNIIVSGHGRLDAAIRLGLKEVPCVLAEGLTEEQIKAFRIADNKVREGSIWDEEALKKEFEELDLLGFDLNETGFKTDEIERVILSDTGLLQDLVEDIPPGLEEKHFSQPGDVWILGSHKLMCGDSTNQESVNILMGGEKANLMLTDPPYNINYEGTEGKKIENDNLDSEKFYSFLKSFYETAFNIMNPGAPFYVFYADVESIAFRKALKEAEFKLSQCLIWVKSGFNLSRQDYNWRHEPCLYGWKPGAAHYFIEDYTQDTVLEPKSPNYKGMKKEELIDVIKELEKRVQGNETIIREDKPVRNDIHPTMKPLKLIGKLMVNSSRAKDIIYEPFCGSGTTLIVGEQLGRQIRAMEYDPKYVDVIVKRYHRLERIDIKLIRNGETYSWNEIKDEILGD